MTSCRSPALRQTSSFRVEACFLPTSSPVMPLPMPLKRAWITSALELSTRMRSTIWAALEACRCAQQISATRSWPLASPRSFWRPMTNSSGETEPLLSASMRSNSCSASSYWMPSKRNLRTTLGLRRTFWNSSKASSPLLSRSASWKSSPMDLRTSNSVFSNTLPWLRSLSSMMDCTRSTITAMMMLVMPKVQTIIANIISIIARALTSPRGRTTSLAQRSRVMTWKTVHIDLHGVPRYCSQ
mmetsp:Transcript_48670/g.110204  ORF Transcript_48670/g.110204 Transcript_48670/m.110204 type:complete len:242 (-) Transcript_48670:103-828(-)